MKREENIVRKLLAVMGGRVTYHGEILMSDGAFAVQMRGPHKAL